MCYDYMKKEREKTSNAACCNRLCNMIRDGNLYMSFPIRGVEMCSSSRATSLGSNKTVKSDGFRYQEKGVPHHKSWLKLLGAVFDSLSFLVVCSYIRCSHIKTQILMFHP